MPKRCALYTIEDLNNYYVQNTFFRPRGCYLGKVDDICYADGIIAGVTTYPVEVVTNQMHYHDSLYISFVLQGGNIENRINGRYERLPGNITFLSCR